jgi:hypothetical protein
MAAKVQPDPEVDDVIVVDQNDLQKICPDIQLTGPDGELLVVDDICHHTEMRRSR